MRHPIPTLAHYWESVASGKLQGTTPERVQLCKLFFYIGAAAFQDINNHIGHPAVTEQEGIAALSQLQAELDQFAKDMEGGKA